MTKTKKVKAIEPRQIVLEDGTVYTAAPGTPVRYGDSIFGLKEIEAARHFVLREQVEENLKMSIGDARKEIIAGRPVKEHSAAIIVDRALRLAIIMMFERTTSLIPSDIKGILQALGIVDTKAIERVIQLVDALRKVYVSPNVLHNKLECIRIVEYICLDNLLNISLTPLLQ